jgi:hypothetical protein
MSGRHKTDHVEDRREKKGWGEKVIDDGWWVALGVEKNGRSCGRKERRGRVIADDA